MWELKIKRMFLLQRNEGHVYLKKNFTKNNHQDKAVIKPTPEKGDNTW